MAAVTIPLAGSAIVDLATALLATVALFAMLRYRTSSAILIGGGAAAGLLLQL